MGGISIWQLLIVALIIVLLFGTKKLRSFGSDFGEAVRGFRGAMNKEESPQLLDSKTTQQNAEHHQQPTENETKS